MEESQSLKDRGLDVRRKVLGAERVQKADANVDELIQPIRDFIDTHCWGAVWTRPGLELRERSIVAMSILAALSRGQELKTHIHGALNNGLTYKEISEVLVQVSIYAGVPVGLEGFRAAKSVVEERGPSDEAGN